VAVRAWSPYGRKCHFFQKSVWHYIFLKKIGTTFFEKKVCALHFFLSKIWHILKKKSVVPFFREDGMTVVAVRGRTDSMVYGHVVPPRPYGRTTLLYGRTTLWQKISDGRGTAIRRKRYNQFCMLWIKTDPRVEKLEWYFRFQSVIYHLIEIRQFSNLLILYWQILASVVHYSEITLLLRRVWI